MPYVTIKMVWQLHRGSKLVKNIIMINKLRILMLAVAFSVAGYSINSFLSKFKASTENIDLRISKEGVDIEIKKFKVIRENSGRIEWELKADIAEINKKNKTTKMSNVEYLYINQNNKKFKVSADYGILKNKTNDLDLKGHVK
ncbi:uncharacterized protein METZ01_LOCUS456546, partial [marine metagenome]